MSSKLDDHEDEIFDRIAGGEDMQDVAAHFKVHRNSLRRWVAAGGEERQARYESAMEENGSWHAERSGKVLYDAWERENLSQAHAGLARDMSKFHQWMAEKRYKRLYGEQPTQVNVDLSLGKVHLDALRKFNTPHIPAAEFKVLSEGDEVPDEA